MDRNKISYWLQLSEQDRQDIFEESATQKGLSAAAIEKDWWVVQTLSMIFSMSYANVLVFKGGTSLSKGWNLIQRFSEDIDLALDREFLGFTGKLSKGDIKKLRRKSYEFITETFTEELKEKFAELGFDNVLIKYREVENHDQDPLIIEIYYPTVIAKDSYLKPAVLVELGSRSLKEPFSKRSFGTIVSEVFADRPFSDMPITIPVVNPERTFLEKIFLLHEEFQKAPDKIRVERLSRHLYDIEKLSRTEYAEIALQNAELYNTIVVHRSKFTPISGIDYANHSPDKINFIPPTEIIKHWERDYGTMTQTMIYDNPLRFDELIKRLIQLQKRINEIG
ncbi:nucleotidyl transferase AbiEii/AbiGii toxin family protein [Niabella drilacis]|uniref:Predicted nucleotidyltransferase component of viral defense system n=1 Tax=Niabella drilacis (strain DSM 25811 / CCM 8410 / CCUG 62505 / LMG 26954 / E90) TaxID=1285928 RepID=A0A1G6XID8_NIADE|nr:nucleotidyl transferase AbiEii/AbiGii toxin family protein [Niabella drilacis]SDD77831.1 Predicted nucleotidyltransferase component of viral defense system [Niabella drilacis]